MGYVDFENGIRNSAQNFFSYIFIDPKLLDHGDIHGTANRDYVREQLVDSIGNLRTSFPDSELDRIIDGALTSSPSVERRMVNVPGSVVIDPTKLDSRSAHSAANRAFVRGELEGHISNLGNSMSNTQVDSIIDDALSSPAGTRRFEIRNLRVSVILVNALDENADSKNELASITSGVRSGRLKTVPGTDAIWDRAIGEHEGEHGNRTTISSPTTRQSILEEFRGDTTALRWLRANGHNDVAQALVDYRVLTAVHSFKADHATGVALIDNDISKITSDYVSAAEQMRSKVLNAVSNEHGLGSERNALRMVEYNPGRFIRTVERALARGEFKGGDASPDLETHVKAYIEAFRRQVDGITPPVPSGARASVDLENGTTPKLTIGGVTAPEFFASIADPAQAQVAVASNDAVFAETSVRAPAENPDTPKVAGMKVA